AGCWVAPRPCRDSPMTTPAPWAARIKIIRTPKALANLHHPNGRYPTWGPFGATIGAGGEVQAILQDVEQRSPGLIAQVFLEASSEGVHNNPPTPWRANVCS